MTACAAGVIAFVLAAATPPAAPTPTPSPSPSPKALPRTVTDREDALGIARKALATAAAKARVELVVREDETVEKGFGWVFFAGPREGGAAASGAPAAVPGLGPLVVHRADGTTRFLSTSVPPDKAVAEYEKQWLRRQRRKP